MQRFFLFHLLLENKFCIFAIQTIFQMKGRVIRFDGRQFRIEFPYNLDVKEALKREVSGRAYNPKEQVWTCPLSSAKSLMAFAGRYCFEVTDEVIDAVKKLEKLEEESRLVRSSYQFSRDYCPLLNGKQLSLYDYQKAGVAYCVKAKRAIIADEMGLGKTVQAIASVIELGALPMLVVCPNSLKRNWRKELELWGGLRVQVIDAGDSVAVGVDAWVINYDILNRYSHFFALNAVGVVFDESHRLKSSKTKRYESAKEIVKDKEVVLLLTGTPIQNKPFELVSQLALIDRLRDFGGWYGFVKRYCGGGVGYGGTLEKDGASNIKELNEKLRATCMVRREKRDVLKDLPKMTRSQVLFMARGSLYEQTLRNVLLNERIGMVEIDALRKASALEKIPFVIDFIEDVIDEGESIVLFAHHKEVVHQLRLSIETKFKISPCVITGDTDGRSRHEMVDRFQRGDVPVMICSMMAAGEGITLTKSSKVGFLEIGWHYAQHAQCEARVDRIGQDYPTTSYYFLSENTVDERDFDVFILGKGDISSIVASGRPLLEFFNLKKEEHV